MHYFLDRLSIRTHWNTYIVVSKPLEFWIWNAHAYSQSAFSEWRPQPSAPPRLGLNPPHVYDIMLQISNERYSLRHFKILGSGNFGNTCLISHMPRQSYLRLWRPRTWPLLRENCGEQSWWGRHYLWCDFQPGVILVYVTCTDFFK